MASSRDRRLFFRQVLFKDCAKLAGAHFDLMVSNDRETQKCLSHSDPRIRLAALKLMSFFWGPTPDFSQTRETLAFEDPDLDVRQMGILAIGTCYGGTNDFRIGKLVAEMVRNTAQPVECRRAAYQVLFYLRGKILEAVASFRFPEEVDWTFVDSFVVRTDCFGDVERLTGLPPFLGSSTFPDAGGWKAAEQALNKGDLYKSVARLSEAVRYMPTASAYLARGELYMNLGRFDDAIRDLSRSLELSPNSAEAYFARRRAYSAKDLFDLSDVDYKKAVELDPSYSPRASPDDHAG